MGDVTHSTCIMSGALIHSQHSGFILYSVCIVYPSRN